MKKLKDGPVAYYDLDDTLIYFDFDPSKPSVSITCHGYTQTYNYHQKHIDILKKHKERGHGIVIWSQGGSDWIEACVKALNLQDYVDVIMPKPHWIYDDLDPSEWMPKRSFIKED